MSATTSTVQPAELAREVTDTVEQLRRALNAAYSEAPDTVATVFETALDQLVDRQVKASNALVSFIENGNGDALRDTLATVLEEASRSALSASRASADYWHEQATLFEGTDLRRIQADTTDLVLKKQEADRRFRLAVQRHEDNDRSAVDLLLQSSIEYKAYLERAYAMAEGTRTLSARERWRQRAVYASLIIAIISLVVAFIGGENIRSTIVGLFSQ